ncbi:MAG: TetR/AcrR family transcriptional regulator, partial [Thermomicrobiales bacterium]
MASVVDGVHVDPRVRRTRTMLEEAVLSLAANQDFSTITVRDITKRADLNRATFYLHYRDKEDLCAQALDGLFDELVAEDRAFVAARERVTVESIPVGITAVLRHCAKRPDLFRRLLADSGSTGFAARLRQYFESGFLQVWADMGVEIAPGSPPATLRARSAAASMQGIIQWWLE